MDLSPDHKRINVTMGGREMEVYGNLTVLQSLIQEGIHIPHLCYDIRLERSNGNCGLCIVEVDGNARAVKSCQTPIKEGMNIKEGSRFCRPGGAQCDIGTFRRSVRLRITVHGRSSQKNRL